MTEEQMGPPSPNDRQSPEIPEFLRAPEMGPPAPTQNDTDGIPHLLARPEETNPTQPQPQPQTKKLSILERAKTNLSAEGLSNFFMSHVSSDMSQIEGAARSLQTSFGESILGGLSEEDQELIPDELKELLGMEPIAQLSEELNTNSMGGESPSQGDMNAAESVNSVQSSVSRQMNNPSAGNQGVIRDQSTAVSPGASPMNHVENMLSSITSPPAHRNMIF